jgi:hypothetical protein
MSLGFQIGLQFVALKDMLRWWNIYGFMDVSEITKFDYTKSREKVAYMFETFLWLSI